MELVDTIKGLLACVDSGDPPQLEALPLPAHLRRLCGALLGSHRPRPALLNLRKVTRSVSGVEAFPTADVDIDHVVRILTAGPELSRYLAWHPAALEVLRDEIGVGA